MPYNSYIKFHTALNSIKYLTKIITKFLQLSTQSNNLQFSDQTPWSSQLNQTPYNSPNKSLTALNLIKASQFSRQTPLSSQLNLMPYNSYIKFHTALNSIKYLTKIITKFLQLSTQSNNLQFSDQTPWSSQLTKRLTILQTNSIQLSTQSNT